MFGYVSNSLFFILLMIPSFALKARTKPTAFNSHNSHIFRVPMHITFSRPYLSPAFSSLKIHSHFFRESTLRKNPVISLNLRPDNNLAVDELVEAGKVDLMPGELEAGWTLPVQHECLLFYYASKCN